MFLLTVIAYGTLVADSVFLWSLFSASSYVYCFCLPLSFIFSFFLAFFFCNWFPFSICVLARVIFFFFFLQEEVGEWKKSKLLKLLSHLFYCLYSLYYSFFDFISAGGTVFSHILSLYHLWVGVFLAVKIRTNFSFFFFLVLIGECTVE